MRNPVSFGIHPFGTGYVVCLNMKIDREERKFLRLTFSGLTVEPHGKGLTRVQGFVPSKEFVDFKCRYKQSILSTKIDALIKERDNWEKTLKQHHDFQDYINQSRFRSPENDDLPF
jgi:hypothetical protein